jgi:hypothetical protein
VSTFDATTSPSKRITRDTEAEHRVVAVVLRLGIELIKPRDLTHRKSSSKVDQSFEPIDELECLNETVQNGPRPKLLTDTFPRI